MKTLRIFISSPGDVEEERERAKQVVESLRRRYAGIFFLKPVLWKELPLQPDMSFQQGIDAVLSRDGVDIAVFILWSRLGSPTGPLVVKEDGTPYRSGTEREYDLMMRARTQSKESDGIARPDILIYTRRDESSFDERLRGQRTGEKEKLIIQKKLVESFIAEEFKDAETGTNTSAYHSFDRPVTFSQRLREHLTALLDERAGEEFNEVVWDIEKQGPPFMGLGAFQPQHADVFFGREDEILEARNTLRRRSRDGCAFLLLSGASGSGKSSLARAGVLPAIVENELDEIVTAWRTVVTSPSELGNDLIAGLVEKLAGPDIVPELRSEVDGLAFLTKGLGTDAETTIELRFRDAFAAAGKRLKGGLRVFIVLDQLEEIFAGAVSREKRESFFLVLAALTRSRLVWALATVRSDFMDRVQEEPVLLQMMEGSGLQAVLPPEIAALRRMIEGPARIAGLSFEEKGGKSLSDQILDDAAGKGELLPLLEFVLEKLFAQRTDRGMLLWQAYAELGGVDGALAARADEALHALPETSQASLGSVLKALVTIGRESARDLDQGRLVRRSASQADLNKIPGAAALVEAFIEERLFTASGDPATVTLAHESLLRVWGRARDWEDQNREFLQTRARVSARIREGSRLMEGDPLLNIAVSHLQLNGEDFSEEERAFIERCNKEAEHGRFVRVKRRRMVTIALSSLTVLALGAAGWALTKQKEAIAAEARIDRQLLETKRQLERSWIEEGRAWFERARVAKEQGDHLGALVYGGRAVGYRGFGRKESESSDFEAAFPHLLGGTMTNPDLDQERKKEAENVDLFLRGIRPRLLPLWSSEPRRSGEKDALVGASRVFFSSDGTRLVGHFDDSVRVWDAVSGAELFKTSLPGSTISGDASRVALVSDLAISVADLASGKVITTLEGFTDPKGGANFSYDGSVLAMATLEGTLRLWHIDEDFLLAELPAEAGRFAAFSPDGTQVATISGDKTVNVWEALGGRKVSSVSGTSRSVSDVSFSPDGGRIVIWDKEDNGGSLQSFTLSGEVGPLVTHRFAIEATAFSPDGEHLATGDGWSDFFNNSDYRASLSDPTKRIKVTHLSTGEEIVMRSIARSDVRALAFSPDGRRLASSLKREFVSGENLSDDDTQHRIDIWDATNGDRLHFIHGHQGTVTDLAFSPDGNRLASASEDGTVKVWDTGTGPELSLTGHEYFVTCATFHPDSSILASGSIDGSKLWDTATGKELLTIPSRDTILALAFSPDGRTLARGTGENPWAERGSGDYGIELIEIATGKEIVRCKVIDNYGVARLAFSPDGRFILGNGDVFDSATGNKIEGPPPFDEKTAETWLNSHENREPVSTDGSYRAWFEDRNVFLSPVADQVPDLASRLRSRMVEFSGSEILVRSSSDLFTHEARSPVARIADPSLSDERHAAWRMILCARANSGTSATRLWDQWTEETAGFDEKNPRVREIYLRALLRFGVEAVENDHPSAYPLIFRIPPLLSQDLLGKPAVSLGLRKLIKQFKGDAWIEPHAALYERIKEITEESSSQADGRALPDLFGED